MSNYISLEDLKKLSGYAIGKRWVISVFPFDSARCRNCVTMHSDGIDWCKDPDHAEFRKVSEQAIGNIAAGQLRPYLEAIYSLRLFYKHLYADNPPEIMEVPNVPRQGQEGGCGNSSEVGLAVSRSD
jgi:hypothetical protein